VFPALLYIIFLKNLSLILSTTIIEPLKARQKNKWGVSVRNSIYSIVLALSANKNRKIDQTPSLN